jgi:hypothetical protein
MNILANILLLFIFVYLATYIGVPGTSKNSYIKNKIFLFGGIFIFQLVINLIIKLNNENGTKSDDVKQVVRDSVNSGILAIVGYSIYNDLTIMDKTKEKMIQYINNRHLNSVVLSMIITSIIAFSKTIELLVQSIN